MECAQITVVDNISLFTVSPTRQKIPKASTRLIPTQINSSSTLRVGRRMTSRNHSLHFCHIPRLIGLYNARKHNVTSKVPIFVDNRSYNTTGRASFRLTRLHRYEGEYKDGPYALRERRLKKLAEMGIIDKSVIPHEVETSTVGVGEWDDLTPEEKKLSSRAMQAYAGMVDSIDVNVGKVVDYLKKTGEYDNTFIVFMSDNGAEGAA